MPHIIVKCYPGRTDETKKALAEQFSKDICEIFKVAEEHVSVAIQEIPRDEWYETVQKPEIEPNADILYKKPGYMENRETP